MTECIVTSSLLIVIVTALRFLFRGKISHRLQYALWGLVLLRILMPFSLFESPFSVMNAVSSESSFGEKQVYLLPVSKKPLNEMSGVTVNSDGAVADANSFGYAVLSGDGSNVTRYAGKMTVGEIGNAIWLFGGIAAGLWVLGTNLLFTIRLRKVRKACDAAGCKLPVYVAGCLASPCLYGIFPPAVYLTPKAAESGDSVRYVLAHELCHYRHGDHIWSIFRGLCIAAYWWNPLVWVAAILSRADSELACDEAVIREIGEDNRLVYGRTLVDMIAVKRAPAGLMCAATTMVSGKRGVRERLNMIIKNPKTAIPALAAVLVIAAACAGVTFTGAKASLSAEEALNQLASSVARSDGQVGFQIPEGYQKPKEWNLHIAGRLVSDGFSQSVHFMEDINSQKAWEPGRRYTIPLNDGYTELTLTAFLPDENGKTLERDIDLLSPPSSPASGSATDAITQYAWDFIHKDIKNYESSDVKITDSKIAALTRIARYEEMTDYPIEVWLLTYRLLPDNINNVVFAGGMRQENGWITEYASMGQPCLIISYKTGEASYMGSTWTGNFSEEGGRENALRMWLESNGYLKKETYPGNHCTVSFSLSDGTKANLILSQPVRQGKTGIWCAERWSDENGNRYLVTPDPGGLAMDYYKKLQEECDGGHRPGLLDPKEVALEYITGVLKQNATLDTIKISSGYQGVVDRTNLDACTADAVLAANKSQYRNGNFATEAHTVLKSVKNGNTATVYAMALCLEFDYENGWFSETGGGHMPVAITFEKNAGGEYDLKEYWTPQDGSYYGPSIKEKFPPDIYSDALDTQKYILAHMQSCYAQAIEYGKTDTDAYLKKLLETICASPAQMSNPGAYIDAHPIEYRELLYCGDYTLKYVYSEFLKGGQTDLRGHIMLSAMRALLGGEDVKLALTGVAQGWFDEWKSHSVQLLNKNSTEFMDKNYPKTAILLHMLNGAK